MRTVLVILLGCLLIGCQTADPDMTAIVGASLRDAKGVEVYRHAIVLIDGSGRFRAVGPQATTPLPKAARRIDGMNQIILPLEGHAIAEGQEADLTLARAMPDGNAGAVERTMRNGQWTQ